MKYNTESCGWVSQKHPGAMSPLFFCTKHVICWKCTITENSRAGEGHQSSTDNDEIQNIPEVTKVRARVKEQSKVNHLRDTEEARMTGNGNSNKTYIISVFFLRLSNLNHHFKSEDSREHVIQILENLHHRRTAEWIHWQMLMNTLLCFQRSQTLKILNSPELMQTTSTLTQQHTTST